MLSPHSFLSAPTGILAWAAVTVRQDWAVAAVETVGTEVAAVGGETGGRSAWNDGMEISVQS